MSTAGGIFNYLRRHYFDDAKLKQLALVEFVRAVRSGRIIAFTGSMTTKDYGYPTWRGLLDDSLAIASDYLKDFDQQRLIPAFRGVAKLDPRFDSRVAFSAVAQMLDHMDASGEFTRKALDRVAEMFTTTIRDAHSPDIIRVLLDDLHIDRIVTTNYDFELERHAMRLTPAAGEGSPWNIHDSIKRERAAGSFSQGGRKEDGYSLVLKSANGDRIVSDTMVRDRPEALIEFAIGCPENDTHIFHLHGRADQPADMILSYRDYDRLYRRRGLGKLPFEHALRILFAGNPVLFVGLGMSEPELNKTLSEFVGDHPYLRKAPAFLIWNTPKTLSADSEGGAQDAVSVDQRKAVFRLDMLHRLGILTIFEDDLAAGGAGLAPAATDVERLRNSLERLVGEVVSAQNRRLKEAPPAAWRHALKRIKMAYGTQRLINTWTAEWTGPRGRIFLEAKPEQQEFMRVLVRPEGASTTGVATAVAECWSNAATDRLAVILNFNMRIDTDSVLAFVADLLRFDPANTDEQNLARTSSRQTEFNDTEDLGLRNGHGLLLVLKGLDRIFDVNGHPLSAEFDDFLRAMASRSKELKGRIKFVAVGTERMTAYLAGLRGVAGTPEISIERLPAADAAKEGSDYLKALEARHRLGDLDIAKLKNREFADQSAKRRTLYRAVLTPAALAAQGVRDPDLALEIITIMSFIGQPIERTVLFHAPAVQRRLGHPKIGLQRRRRRFKRAFRELLRTGLVKEVNKRKGAQRRPKHTRRYAVHLSLQTEIRDRNGLPLSDAILSTAYNMSLFSAQPADGALPEAEVHDELGRLVDWLAGAHNDEPLERPAPGLHGEVGTAAARRAPHASAALRAAVSLVRGLYSTSALLSVDRASRLIGEERDGLLGEHAQRLERILESFDEMWRARCGERAEGVAPLYADELVWLHNERGVVKLAQGDLYEARFSFSEADRINRHEVEFNDQSHNWRRITLNQVLVDVERGKLHSAEERMNAIERRLGPDKVERIHSRYLDSVSEGRIGFDPVVSHEDILAMTLITGYRALTSHLRGELDAARNGFDRAIRVAQRMDEQRALALFRRHKASVHADLDEVEPLRREIRLAMSGAESVRQLDIVYAARLLQACAHDEKGSAEERRKALRAALEALDYATHADMHRLSIEAQARLARAKFHSGDYDAALEHASEAMATATRYGMTLHKISLRTLMGQILVRRGNGEAGRTLIQNAMNGAMRVGYQRALGSARQALAEAIG